MAPVIETVSVRCAGRSGNLLVCVPAAADGHRPYDRLRRRHHAETTAPPGAQPITPDRAFNVARAALPGATPFYINVPEPRELYFVRMRYPEDLTPSPSKAVASLASLTSVMQVLSGAMMWWRGR